MEATASKTLLPCDVENDEFELMMVIEAGFFEAS